VSDAHLFDAIAEGAVTESPLWCESLLAPADRDATAIFSALVPTPRQALGLETIYEGYLLHHGRSRLFAPTDPDIALLLGDTLLAHGLVRIAALGDAAAIADLAMLLSLCSQVRAEGRAGDAEAWAATAARLGRGGLDEARLALRVHGDPGPLLAAANEAVGAIAVTRAIAAHRQHVL
jgi:hypothetical protein